MASTSSWVSAMTAFVFAGRLQQFEDAFQIFELLIIRFNVIPGLKGVFKE